MENEKNIIVYNKLIRDKIPEIIIDSGKSLSTEILDEASYKKELDKKLLEEVEEYLRDDNVEELADIIEVILAILDYKGVSRPDFEMVRESKVEKRGAFKERIFLKEVIHKD